MATIQSPHPEDFLSSNETQKLQAELESTKQGHAETNLQWNWCFKRMARAAYGPPNAVTEQIVIHACERSLYDPALSKKLTFSDPQTLDAAIHYVERQTT